MTKITAGVTFSNNPGWQSTVNDHLKLPNGKTVGETDSSTLYQTFDRLGVPGFSHSLGRPFAIEKYAEHVAKIAKAGADAAVADYLRRNGNDV